MEKIEKINETFVSQRKINETDNSPADQGKKERERKEK